MDEFDHLADLDDGIEANPFCGWSEDQDGEIQLDIDAIAAKAEAYDQLFGDPPF